MNEALIVGALLLVFVGAVSFYLYSRIIFNERKMGLIESLLLDIKMTMDMEEEHRAAHAPVQAPVATAPSVVAEDKETTGPIEVEEMDEAEEYKNVLEEAASMEATTTVPPPPPSAKNYDDSSRDDLAALAERRGLRVTKRMAKGTIIALLQEADKAAPQQGDDVAGSGTSLSAVEGSGGGAPLDAVALEEME